MPSPTLPPGAGVIWRALARGVSVAVAATFGVMLWLVVLSDLYGNKEYLTYPAGRGPFSWCVEGVAGLALGFWASHFFHSNPAKLATSAGFAGLLLAMNVRRGSNLSGLPGDPEAIAALAWLPGMVAVGAAAELGMVRWVRTASAVWWYTARDGSRYPVCGAVSRPHLGLALCGGAVGVWTLASLQYVLVGISGDGHESLTAGINSMAMFFCGFFVWAIGRRWRSPPVEAALREDARPPILYLRSFRDDDTPTGTGALGTLYFALESVMSGPVEQRMASRLRRIAPLIAVGRPGDALPPIGAARLYLRDEDWQAVVRDLVSRCLFVMIHVGETDGLLWEMETIRGILQPDRVVLYIPVRARWWDLLSKARYRRLRETTESGLKCRLPERHGKARLVFFHSDWVGQGLRSRWDIPESHPLRSSLERLIKDKHFKS